MRVRARDGSEHAAKLTADHPASSYGQPVLVVGGEGYGPLDLAGWSLVKATAAERAALERAGFATLLPVDRGV